MTAPAHQAHRRGHITKAVMGISRGILLSTMVIVWTAAPAHAQWVATPFLGMNLAGDAEFRRGGPGGSVGYFGSWLGFEFEAQRYHHFFKDTNVDLVPNMNAMISAIVRTRFARSLAGTSGSHWWSTVESHGRARGRRIEI